MKNNFFSVKLKISGVNITRFIKKLISQNIPLYNVQQPSHKEVTFITDGRYVKKIKQICNENNLQLEKVQNYGIYKIKNFAVLRMGFCFGLIIFILLNFFSSLFIWNIKIYGNNKIEITQIYNVLKNNGIQVGKMVSNSKADEIENILQAELPNISMISIIKKGSTIIVNIKEKLYVEDVVNLNKQTDLVAVEDMLINNINVIQGTANVKAGDSIKAGDVIVFGYFESADGSTVPCKANAKINATIYKSQTEIFEKKKIVKVKTGAYVENLSLSFLGAIMPIKNEANMFNCFEVVQTEKFLFSNNLLPFKIISNKYYEAEEKVVEQNFEQEKERIINSCKEKALSKVANVNDIIKTYEFVEELNDVFVVTAYVEVSVII